MPAMTDWVLKSEDKHGDGVCGPCGYTLESCSCAESFEFVQGSESTNDYSSEDNSGSSGQYIDCGSGYMQQQQQQQQHQPVYSTIAASSFDHGLTSRRLGELQSDLTPSSRSDSVALWEGAYNPINSRLFGDATNALEISDGYESSASTVLPAPDQGRNEAPAEGGLDLTFNVRRPIPERDFINGVCTRIIWLVGVSVAVQSLLHTVGTHGQRQPTSGFQQMCALYALEISLRAMYHDSPGALVYTSFEYLLSIFNGPDYRQVASSQAAGFGNRQVLDGLLSPRNLSVDEILIVLQILGRRMGEAFALGVCAPATRGAAGREFTYDVYLRSASPDGYYRRVVWIFNNNVASTNSGPLLNHWSGFGYTPSFRLNVDDIDPVTTNMEAGPPAACSSSSTAESSSFLTGFSQLSTHSSHAYSSRMSSIEPDYTSYHNDSLSPRNPSTMQRTSSQSSRSSFKELVQCEICGKLLQKKSLSKHTKTHNRDVIEQERKHRCSRCGKGFQHPKDVRRHQSTHSSTRKWKCSVLGCSFASGGFTRKDHLDRHMATVHSYKCFHFGCPHATNGFATHDDLVLHMETVHSYKCRFLDCPYATNGFTTESDLDRHVATVHCDPGPPDFYPPDIDFDERFNERFDEHFFK